MNAVKATLGASAILFAATSAHAGGMAEPIMTVPEVVEPTKAASSGAGLIIPLILIALVAVAVSSK
jgi:hypothetical protein